MWPLLIPALVTAGATLLSGLFQSNAAKDAAASQAKASQAGIDETRRQFDVMRDALRPYTQTGTTALASQADLLGLNGPEAQRRAIETISASPEMAAMTQQGEEAMLTNASATGGLRGGNLQGALATFRPQVLSQLINQQYAKLGDLTSIGQASAAGVGAGAIQSGANIATLLAQQGQAAAAGKLATGNALASIPNALLAGLGVYVGGGGTFGGGTVPTNPMPAGPGTDILNPYGTVNAGLGY